MKHLALDLGTVWTGIAISDALNMLARPLKTVATVELFSELEALILKEPGIIIIVGNPLTMKGTESAQTRFTLQFKERLENKFLNNKFILWDERMTSLLANEGKKVVTKAQKLQSHARAAALILESYLEFLSYQRQKSQKAN